MAARLLLVISESSVSIANNTSVVTAKLYYYGNGVSYNYNSKPGTIVIDGTSYSFSASFTKSTSAQLLATKSKTVTHNSNGAKTVSCSASYTTGVSIGTLSTSASKALTTIPRVSDLSVNKSSIPADGTTTVTATATKKSSSFTDTIVVKLGSYSKTVTSGTAFTIPASWINAIAGTSATATVTVTTKSGSTTIGTKSVNLTVTVPSTVVPSISSVTVAEAVTAVQSAFGSVVYVSSLSKLNVSISAAGVYGSTISSVKTTFDGITYDGASFQTAAISKAGTLSMSVTVTDSRGRTKTTTKNITVYGYSSPMITNVSCVSSGTSTIVTVDGVVSPVAVGSANKNTKTLTIGYKKSTAPAYGGTTTVTIPAASWTFSVSKTFAIDSRTTTYDFEAKLTDKLSTATEHGTTGVPVISRLAGGKGVTLFKEATEEGFWVGDIDYTITDDEYDELLSLLGGVVRLIDWIYPVGAVLASVNPDYNPNNIFKTHTWERFAKGQTLVGVNESDTAFSTAGKTGGEKTHKLTTAEMPSHKHIASTAYAITSFTSGRTAAGGSQGAFAISSTEIKNEGGSTAHNNLQPYTTVYYWKRTA